MHARSQRRGWPFHLRATLALLTFLSAQALADPPSFTGDEVLASGPTSIVNLRAQGAITGTAPMNVQVNGVRVGGVLSPLISVLRTVLQPGASASVCVEVQNLLGLDLTFLGVEVDVTAFNADAPGGVSGRITLQTGVGGEDTSPLACSDAVILPPTANAGPDQNLADTDQQPGENVTLNAAGSVDPDGTIVSYEWRSAANQQVATGVNPTVRLADGTQTLTLVVTDNTGSTATDTVNITVTAPATNQAPIAEAGPNRVVADTDNQPGENVALDGTLSSDADGTLASHQWFTGTTLLATGPTPTVRLNDGPQTLTLRVTDNAGAAASDTVTITVGAANLQLAPLANGGLDRTVADTDAEPGEDVAFDASASADADGVIVSYQWTLNGQAVATGITTTLRLPDGVSGVTLTVVDDDGNSATDNIQVTVAAAPIIPVLSAIAGLTPNQLSVAVAMDALCPRLNSLASRQPLAGDQADLLARCDAIRFGSSTQEQITALDEISPQDLNATRTQTLNLSRSQLANVADRLIALRGGARGLSLVGLNLQLDGRALPLDGLADAADFFFGGGASSDEGRSEEASARGDRKRKPSEIATDLLDERLGVWLRGNYSFGSKEGTIADHGFDADQWGLMSGVDFRFSPRNVAGLALGYGRSQVTFNPVGQGDLNTRAMTAALYATMYTRNGFYVDAIANYLQSDYDSTRRLLYAEGGALRDLNAQGTTRGGTRGIAFTLGYDLNVGPFTVAPSFGYNYMESTIDSFREYGAAGLDLAYQEQSYTSATANAGLRLTYAWKTAIGVIVPQLRGEYIREFIDDTEAFGVRFANDPFDQETPLIVVHTEEPDRSYWRIAAGFAAQFRYGISGFVEYQRLESLEYFDYADVALGLRFETGFN